MGSCQPAWKRARWRRSVACERYVDAEPKLLLRYGTETYQSILGATNELKTIELSPKAKATGIRKPGRAR
jgi:hypothetical protein